MRKKAQPTMPWPAQWTELAKRARLYVGECAGIVGPTGGGKTSFALQIAIAARGDRIPVLWSPLELDPPEIDLRLVANMRGIHTARVRDEWDRDQIAADLTAVEDLWRYVPRERSVEKQIEAYRVAIRICKAFYRKPPLLVIDYIGKLARNSRDPRLATADAAESIRELTVAEECYTLILAQPSRANNSTLTGERELESATQAIAVAGESSEIEHACAVMLGLNVFKQDDRDELDAHILVTKARGTGREGREGFRFHKPGGVWKALDHLPPTPMEIAAKVKRDKKDKARPEPSTKESARNDLNLDRASDADGERRNRIMGALHRAGMIGLTVRELRKVPGTGRSQRLAQSLQELERSGDIEKLTTGKWRKIFR
jgi:KaiC/GvpD/RAD55 family RecA-like ATPase